MSYWIESSISFTSSASMFSSRSLEALVFKTWGASSPLSEIELDSYLSCSLYASTKISMSDYGSDTF